MPNVAAGRPNLHVDRHQSPLYEEAALSRIQQVIDTLEAERAEVQKHLAWLDRQINEFHAHNGSPVTVAPARSCAARLRGVRAIGVLPPAAVRATSRRASSSSSPSTPGVRLVIRESPEPQSGKRLYPVDPAREDRPDPKSITRVQREVGHTPRSLGQRETLALKVGQ